jgi:hypothetical protein
MNASIFAIPIAGVSTLFGCLIAGFVLLLLLLRRKRGWRQLVELYGTPNTPAGRILLGQWIKIGAVDYEGSARVWIADEGLYLRIWWTNVLIPWSEFTYADQVTIYWQRMSELTVGDPPVTTITVKNDLFELMRGRLVA